LLHISTILFIPPPIACHPFVGGSGDKYQSTISSKAIPYVPVLGS
jgi:hypothetical protein